MVAAYSSLIVLDINYN